MSLKFVSSKLTPIKEGNKKVVRFDFTVGNFTKEQVRKDLRVFMTKMQKENEKAKKDLQVEYAIVYEDDERRVGKWTSVNDGIIDLYDESDSMYAGTKKIKTVVAFVKG